MSIAPSSDSLEGSASEAAADDRVAALEAALEEQRRLLIEQEHRLWSAIQNYLAFRDSRRQSPEAEAQFKAARTALVRRLIFRPGALALSIGGAGLAGILVAAWTALLFQQQNTLFEEQNALFRSQNQALLQQFTDEAEDRMIARTAELLDIVYRCNEGADAPPRERPGSSVYCEPISHPRARREAVYALQRLQLAARQPLDLSEADLGPTLRLDFSGQSLQHARFSRSNLLRTDFTGADLTAAELNSTLLINADFDRATLRGARIRHSDASAAGFREADLREVDFLRSDLSHSDFRDADLERASLMHTTLDQAHFRAAKMSRANLSQAQAVDGGVVFKDADLSDADLTGANFRFTSFIGTDLTRAHLVRARLAEATFIATTLHEADFEEAYLGDAYFSGCDLSSAKNLTQQQLDSARGDLETKLPAHLTRPDHWEEPEWKTQPLNTTSHMDYN